MEYTGERYVPELSAAKISYEHWHRYFFAGRFCNQKKVLDIASGEGFGSAFLAKSATSVIGVDVSEEAINHANEKYRIQNLQFLKSNATQLPFNDNFFDVIVSFETLEHINEVDQQLFLSEVSRTICQDGLLIISTPNKKVYSDEANYSNPYHLAEFYRKDFELFLRRFFPNVSFFEQQIIGGSEISNGDDTIYTIDHLHMGANEYKPGRADSKKEKEYLIAVCSKETLPSLQGSILLDDDNSLINQYQKPH